MRTRDRLIALGVLIAVLAVGKLGQHLYRWQTYAPERAEIARLVVDLEESALGIVDTQIRANDLRQALESFDLELREARGGLDLFERNAYGGSLPAGHGRGYRAALDAYNGKVADRNDLFGRWRRTLEENRLHVDRYNLVADSIRGLAARMGDPYFPIRSPAEIAVSRGWGPPEP